MIARTTFPNPDRWIDRCRSRLRFGEFLRSAADWLAVYLFVFGAAILLIKLVVPEFWPRAIWLCIGSVPVALAAWSVSGRRQFGRRDSIALLDSRLEAGGLLMTLSEAPDSEWEHQLPHLEAKWTASLPGLRPVRFVRQISPAMVFVAIACLIPPREVEARAELQSTAGRQAAQHLHELLSELADSEIVNNEERQDLQEEIDKLLNETKDTPLTHAKWETVDALQDRMRLRLEESAGDVARLQATLGVLQDAGIDEQLRMPPESQMQLEEEISRTIRKMMQRGAFDDAPQSLQKELQQLTKSGQFKMPTKQNDRQKLLGELSRALARESERLSELRSKCEAGQCHNPGNGDRSSGPASSRPGAGGSPGRGGIGQGGDDASLTWGDESSEHGIRFKATVLPPGSPDQVRDQVVGVSGSAPKVEAGNPGTRQSPREATAASGSETWNRSVRPRHRSVVRRYFDEHNEGRPARESLPLRQ